MCMKIIFFILKLKSRRDRAFKRCQLITYGNSNLLRKVHDLLNLIFFQSVVYFHYGHVVTTKEESHVKLR